MRAFRSGTDGYSQAVKSQGRITRTLEDMANGAGRFLSAPGKAVGFGGLAAVVIGIIFLWLLTGDFLGGFMGY